MTHPAYRLVVGLLLLCGCVAQDPAPAPKPQVPPKTEETRTPPPAEPKKLHEITVGEEAVKVRLALTTAERFKGLEGVKSLPENEGMLFAYKVPAVRRFWMRGCEMALDIAFLADDGEVLSIATLDPPAVGTKEEDLKRAESPRAIRLVLEMPGGWFEKKKIRKGSRVLIPKSVPLDKAE